MCAGDKYGVLFLGLVYVSGSRLRCVGSSLGFISVSGSGCVSVSCWCLTYGVIYYIIHYYYYIIILYYTILSSSSFPSLLFYLLTCSLLLSSSSSSHLLLIQSIRVGTYIYLFIFYQYSIIQN